MITYEEAHQLVMHYLEAMEAESRREADSRKLLTLNEHKVLGLESEDHVLELTILEKKTIAGDFGWVFFYQSKEYIESGDITHALIGNAPILVSRENGKLHETGTACPIDEYIENFKRSGDPHNFRDGKMRSWFP